MISAYLTIFCFFNFISVEHLNLIQKMHLHMVDLTIFKNIVFVKYVYVTIMTKL